MSDQLQFRGGTTAQHSVFTGAPRELTVDTDKHTVVVHDGAMAGGFPLMRQDLRNLASGALLRNRLINGAMEVDQRNNGAAQTITAATPAYCVDRWYGYCTGANVTGQQVAGSGATRKRYQFTGAASVTSIGFAQRIEAENCYDLNNATATLSVDLANSLLTSVSWAAYYANTEDTFGTVASPTKTLIASGTFTVNATISRYTANIAIPAAATTGIEIVLSVGAQTSGTWTIGNVQLESGAAATPFEIVSRGLGLSLCQRYYYRTKGAAIGDRIGFGFCLSTIYGMIGFKFPQTMRVAPTVLDQSGVATDYSVTSGGGTPVTCNAVPAITTSNADECHVNFFVASGLTTGQGANGRANAAGAYLGFSAEL